MDTDWTIAAQVYVSRVAHAEYLRDRKNNKKWRYNPSEYVRTLVRHIGENNEQAFKAFRMEQGYSSVLGL